MLNWLYIPRINSTLLCCIILIDMLFVLLKSVKRTNLFIFNCNVLSVCCQIYASCMIWIEKCRLISCSLQGKIGLISCLRVWCNSQWFHLYLESFWFGVERFEIMVSTSLTHMKLFWFLSDKQYLGPTYTKNDLLFIWNSDLMISCVFLAEK